MRKARWHLYEAVIVVAFTHQPRPPLSKPVAASRGVDGVHRSPNQVGLILKQPGLQRRKRGAIPGTGAHGGPSVEQHAFETQALTPRLKKPAGQRTSLFRCRSLCAWVILELGSGTARCWQPTPVVDSDSVS